MSETQAILALADGRKSSGDTIYNYFDSGYFAMQCETMSRLNYVLCPPNCPGEEEKDKEELRV